MLRLVEVATVESCEASEKVGEVGEVGVLGWYSCCDDCLRCLRGTLELRDDDGDSVMLVRIGSGLSFWRDEKVL